MKRQHIIQKLEKVLRGRRDALRRSISGELEHENPVDEHGVGDEIDAALDTDFREMCSGLAAAESRELASIEHALRRMKEGTYGTCERCHRKIPVARLQALPYATTCVKCQVLRERRFPDDDQQTDDRFQNWSKSQRRGDYDNDPAADNLNLK